MDSAQRVVSVEIVEIGNSEWDWIINYNIVLLSWASKNQSKFSIARKSEKKLLVNVGILSISTTKNSKVC